MISILTCERSRERVRLCVAIAVFILVGLCVTAMVLDNDEARDWIFRNALNFTDWAAQP